MVDGAPRHAVVRMTGDPERNATVSAVRFPGRPQMNDLMKQRSSGQ